MTIETPGLYADRIPDDASAAVRASRDNAAAIAAYHRSLVARLSPDPIPLVTAEVAPIGQSYEARRAREYLASRTPNPEQAR